MFHYMKTGSSPKPRAPNILLITTDQQRADHLGLKGLEAITTPNLDRLGKEGIHFDRAYCPSPICTPTRLSLLTGRYPSSHGGYSIGVTLPSIPCPTLPALLGEVGYVTALFGKSHFVSRAMEAQHMAGTAEIPSDFFRHWKGPYLGFQEFAGSSGHSMNAQPEQHYREYLRDAGVDWKDWFPSQRADYDHHFCGSWNIPEMYHDTHWVAGETLRFIDRQREGVPWFCWASFQDPHEPFACPEPWYSSVDTDKMSLFEGYVENEFNDRHPIYEACYRRELSKWRDGPGVPCVYGTPEKMNRARNAMQATLGMLAFIDDRVGSILQKLEQLDQLKNTIVIFTSDHGEMHGHHGLWGKGITAYEDCQRVPLLIWGPGLVVQRGTLPALANLIDLPATILSLAGVDVPSGFQGKDLSPILKGGNDSVQDCTLVECRPTQSGLYQQSLITERYKIVIYRDETEGELYDLEADPEQYHNLWCFPEMQQIRDGLLLRMIRFQMEREPRVEARHSFS